MKKILEIVLIGGLFFFMTFGCEKTNTDYFRIKNFSHSDCINTTPENDNRKSVFQSSITFKAVDNNLLQIIHENVLFNCCGGRIFAECGIKKNIITINEKETDHSCNCICPYDLDYTVGVLDTGVYTIIILKMNHEYFQHELNFNSNTDTTIVINK